MKYPYIVGHKCYRSIAGIKDDIDVAIFALPAQRVIECRKPVEKVRSAIILSAGFKEMGGARRRLEEELKNCRDNRGGRIRRVKRCL